MRRRQYPVRWVIRLPEWDKRLRCRRNLLCGVLLQSSRVRTSSRVLLAGRDDKR